MKKIKLIIYSLLFFCLIGCNSDSDYTNVNVSIMGDIYQPIILDGFSDYKITKLDYNDSKVDVISVKDVIDSVEIISVDSSITFYSYDGVIARVGYDQIDSLYLTYKLGNGFSVISLDHPPQIGVKFIEKIVIVSNTNDIDKTFNVINKDHTTRYTYGELFYLESLNSIVLEGQPNKGEFTLDVYTKREVIPLSSFCDGELSNPLGIFSDSSELVLDIDGYIELRSNSVDYIDSDKKTRIKDLKGIWFDYPLVSIIDIYDRVLNSKEDVMIILVDGLGINTYYTNGFDYLNSLSYDNHPFISYNLQHARTVYPSISPVALSSLVTGTLPNVHGIIDRSGKDLKVDDMYLNLDSIIIEGYSTLINLSKSQMLNIDTNDNNSNDDEVFQQALLAIKEQPELLFLHFHGYDDLSHTYGPHVIETKEKAVELDSYIKSLVDEFNGRIIITSDHGQHDTNGKKLGDHGEIRHEDMIIPIIEIVK